MTEVDLTDPRMVALYAELIPQRPPKRPQDRQETPGWVNLKRLAEALREVPAQREGRAAEA